MTRAVEHIEPEPDIIPARVNIHHLQLRDLLQPTGVKDKVIFVGRLQIEQADFTTLKQPSTYCTLDFQPNCLTTGCGLLAAGGQHGELALRPLHSPSSAAPHLQLDPSYSERPPAPWLLRTPTGGSINNAITIQADLNYPSSSRAISSASTVSRSTSPSKADVIDDGSTARADVYSPWARDEPSLLSSSSHVIRPGLLFGDEEMESELSQSVFEELAAAYGFDPSSVNRSSRWRRSAHARSGAATASTTHTCANADLSTAANPIKIMVSNNDQSIKLYKLRPPKSAPGTGGRIEAGLPGLSRNTTLHFPTAINHSSLSPDQRTLIAVGDTPEVFIHSVSRSGEHVKIATYSASTDACFSTSWSPDGSKFAVASQDGVVSVWDVRSSRRLAGISTSQPANAGSGSGAARVVKFSPCGRFLAFTEHRNYWAVTDTVSFTETQRIAAPTVASASTAGGGAGGGEGWADRFRLVTGGDEAIARDRERRSMIHATFMREWNRAINLVDRRPSPASTTGTTSTTTGGGLGVTGTHYFPDHLTTTSPSPLPSALLSTRRREDLLSTALNPSIPTPEPTSSSTNISGLCWDPDSESIFLSTERCIAKYAVRDTRLSIPHATLL